MGPILLLFVCVLPRLLIRPLPGRLPNCRARGCLCVVHRTSASDASVVCASAVCAGGRGRRTGQQRGQGGRRRRPEAGPPCSLALVDSGVLNLLRVPRNPAIHSVSGCLLPHREPCAVLRALPFSACMLPVPFLRAPFPARVRCLTLFFFLVPVMQEPGPVSVIVYRVIKSMKADWCVLRPVLFRACGASSHLWLESAHRFRSLHPPPFSLSHSAESVC